MTKFAVTLKSYKDGILDDSSLLVIFDNEEEAKACCKHVMNECFYFSKGLGYIDCPVPDEKNKEVFYFAKDNWKHSVMYSEIELED